MIQPETTATPWTTEHLAELLPTGARIEPSRWGIHADWTTTAGTWTLTASWHTHRDPHIAIHGPKASTTLTDPSIDLVEGSLLLLGAIPAPDLPDDITHFGERYIDAWREGDISQQNRVLDQLHTALNQQMYGPR